MAELPILFNTEMVKAILEGRKTQTRRVVKCRWYDYLSPVPLDAEYKGIQSGKARFSMGIRSGECKLPYKEGDELYVRETWCKLPVDKDGKLNGKDNYYYIADGDLRPDSWKGNWRPSIHMPMEVERIWLRITKIEIQRLQDMTEEDALREGFKEVEDLSNTPLGEFSELWDTTIRREDIGRTDWDSNPWVWVITFERIEGERQ